MSPSTADVLCRHGVASCQDVPDPVFWQVDPHLHTFVENLKQQEAAASSQTQTLSQAVPPAAISVPVSSTVPLGTCSSTCTPAGVTRLLVELLQSSCCIRLAVH